MTPQKNPAFDPTHCHAQVWDLSDKAGLPSSIREGSVDVAIMIFVLSALHPDEWPRAVENAWRVCLSIFSLVLVLNARRCQMLKPGGVLLVRDYGRNGSWESSTTYWVTTD